MFTSNLDSQIHHHADHDQAEAQSPSAGVRSVAVRPDAAAEVEPADVGSQTAGAGSQAAVARLVLDLKLDLKLLVLDLKLLLLD